MHAKLEKLPPGQVEGLTIKMKVEEPMRVLNSIEKRRGIIEREGEEEEEG